MKPLLIALLLCSFNAAAGDFYIEVGAGIHGNLFSNDLAWKKVNGTGALIRIGYQEKIADDVYLNGALTHLSYWDVGPPFNSKNEPTVDHLGGSVIWFF